ncbi:hypothetical protein J3492_03510 [Psychrobacter sp. F1192]|uniref:ABC transporter permease n=1 Tax=Psychrobacter coccoides TaxID=2818440 RepID=A0ABS3NM40_9GAMM|nr:hypothetical protein [Psychrobacter coccoides]MBO1530281.1 hypothetical protein [Psychrobacter coccoides]
MLTIIVGHLLGAVVPLFIFKNIKITPSDFGGEAIVYLALIVLLLFVEYQLVRSIKYGRVYFRGHIDESEGLSFKSCQFAYAVQGGFFIAILLQGLFS